VSVRVRVGAHQGQWGRVATSTGINQAFSRTDSLLASDCEDHAAVLGDASKVSPQHLNAIGEKRMMGNPPAAFPWPHGANAALVIWSALAVATTHARAGGQEPETHAEDGCALTPGRRETRAALERLALGYDHGHVHLHGLNVSRCMAWFDELDNQRVAGPVRVWAEARRRAGLAPLTSHEVKVRARWMRYFYTQRRSGGTGAITLRSSSGCGSVGSRTLTQQVTYLRNFKVANDMICNNLGQWGRANNVTVGETPAGTDLKAFMDDVSAFECSNTTTFAERFTFVRDPIARFISGYKEAGWRANTEYVKGEVSQYLSLNDTTAEALAVVRALLDARDQDLIPHMIHVSAQS